MMLFQALIKTPIALLALIGMTACRPQRKGVRASDQELAMREHQDPSDLLESQDPRLAAEDQDEEHPLRIIGQNKVTLGRPKQIRKEANLHKRRPKVSIADRMTATRRHRRSTDDRDGTMMVISDYPNITVSTHRCKNATRMQQEWVEFEFPDGSTRQVPVGCKAMTGEGEEVCSLETVFSAPVSTQDGRRHLVKAENRTCEGNEGGLPRGPDPRGLWSDHVCKQQFVIVKFENQEKVRFPSGCVPRSQD